MGSMAELWHGDHVVAYTSSDSDTGPSYYAAQTILPTH